MPLGHRPMPPAPPPFPHPVPAPSSSSPDDVAAQHQLSASSLEEVGSLGHEGGASTALLKDSSGSDVNKPSLQLKPWGGDVLHSYFQQLFRLGDKNGDGSLSPFEVSHLLQLCGFQLDPGVVLQLLQDCDCNHDGKIQYDEFIPLMMSALKIGEAESSVEHHTKVIVSTHIVSAST